MKVVLRDDVDGLGRKGDMCEVADGYARNFLVPRGLAFRATPGSESQAEAMRRAAALRSVADREDAEAMAETLTGRVVTIEANAGDGGRLFGSVTAADIVAALEDQTGAVVDRRALQLDSPIKTVGTHTVSARPHPEVEVAITVEVMSG